MNINSIDELLIIQGQREPFTKIEINCIHMMPEKEEMLLYRIAITLIPGIGHMNAKKLISWCGGPEAVFKKPKSELLKIPGMIKLLGRDVNFKEILQRAEQEVIFVRNSRITPLYYYDDDYPIRLKHCVDSPLLLYYKGVENFMQKKMLAIVGTRQASSYGRRVCEEIIKGFAGDDVLIISGMAYGIDSCAHRKALSYGLNTVGVLGHGLDRIYPMENRSMAVRMLKQGGLITEFLSNSKPDRENFPKRNRIIAGLSDAVLVVESAKKGGAVITADIANSYNRDVFAVPGKVHDKFSDGCHLLIRRNIAALARSADDIRYSMGWEGPAVKKKNQAELLKRHSPDEQKILSIIAEKIRASVDDIVIICGLGASKTASVLLKLEFEGVITALPGKLYEIRR
jgi:DNA processing protein